MVRRPGRTTIAAGAALALGAAAALAATAADPAQAAGPAPHVLAGSHPQWATADAARGTLPAPTTVTAQVYLAPRGGERALNSFVAAVSTPGTAAYGGFLSAPEYHARFDPTAATVARVTAYLTAHGLRVTGVERFHTYLTVTGSAAAADDAFGTTLVRYRHDGLTVQAPAADLQLPAALAAQVLGVTGLNTAANRARPATVLPPPEAGYKNAVPCSQYFGQVQATDEGDYTTPLPPFDGQRLSYAVCGYVPAQLRSAYGVADSTTGAVVHDGTGQTIAIVDAYASPTIAADADQYATRQGDRAFAPGQFSQSLPGSYNSVALCGGSGWYGEESLDVEAAHAMAPGADIRYYGAASCLDPDLDAALRRIVNDDVASIVSNSYGLAELGEDAGSVVAFESVAKQAAAQGIGFDFSSGDYGDQAAAYGFIGTFYPASDPYSTAVGGTSTGIGADGTRTFQTGWGTEKAVLTAGAWSTPAFTSGSGGGYSDLFQRPAYQLGVVPTTNRGSRAVPDLAADADPSTGMLIGETQTFSDGVRYSEYRVGGTSLASPLTAGMLADVQQAVGHRLGFLNPLIYTIAAKRGSAFTDVLPQTGSTTIPLGVVRPDYADPFGFDPAKGYLYSVRIFDRDSSLTTTKGWDDVTGVGTPVVPNLISAVKQLG